MNLSVNVLTENSRIGHYAGFVSRLIAFLIDTVIASIALAFSTWFVKTTIQPARFGAILSRLFQGMPALQSVVNFLFSPTMAAIISIGFVLFYYVFFWYAAGQTPGKAILGIKIVSLSGRKLTLLQTIVRYIGYFISAFVLGLGFAWILIDDRRLGWHDRLARTCVIYAWDARPDETFLASALDIITKSRNGLRQLLGQVKTPQPFELPSGTSEITKKELPEVEEK